MVPEGVVRGVRNAGVEVRLFELPTQLPANPSGKCGCIVVGKRVAKRLFGSVKEVLAIDKDKGPFDRRLRGHGRLPAQNNPTRGLAAGRVGSKSIKLVYHKAYRKERSADKVDLMFLPRPTQVQARSFNHNPARGRQQCRKSNVYGQLRLITSPQRRDGHEECE